MGSETLEIWVIYVKPSDYPNSVVLRAWTLHLRENTMSPHGAIVQTDTIEAARSYIPEGKVKTMPMKEDDPVIAEVWI